MSHYAIPNLSRCVLLNSAFCPVQDFHGFFGLCLRKRYARDPTEGFVQIPSNIHITMTHIDRVLLERQSSNHSDQDHNCNDQGIWKFQQSGESSSYADIEAGDGLVMRQHRQSKGIVYMQKVSQSSCCDTFIVTGADIQAPFRCRGRALLGLVRYPFTLYISEHRPHSSHVSFYTSIVIILRHGRTLHTLQH